MTDAMPPLAKAMTRDDLGMLIIDCVEIDGTLWLIPEWGVSRTAEYSTPKRAIGLASGDWRRATGPHYQYVAEQVPTAVLEGHVPPALAARFRVVHEPNWQWFRFPDLPKR